MLIHLVRPELVTYEEIRAVPDGVAANIDAALLLTTAQGLLETFLALRAPNC